MLKRSIFSLVTLITVAGCGGSGGSEAEIVANEAALPTCDDSMEGAQYFVKDTSDLKVCNGTSWTSIGGTTSSTNAVTTSGNDGVNGTNGTNGIAVSSRWRFHTDTFVGQTDISSESGSTVTYLGTV